MTENEKKSKTKKEKTEGSRVIIPSLGFSSLVLPFYTQALLSLKEEEDSKDEEGGKNLELAKRLIDLLDLLKKKTQGNLKPEEEKFLNACLDQLKLSYMEKAKIIKL